MQRGAFFRLRGYVGNPGLPMLLLRGDISFEAVGAGGLGQWLLQSFRLQVATSRASLLHRGVRLFGPLPSHVGVKLMMATLLAKGPCRGAHPALRFGWEGSAGFAMGWPFDVLSRFGANLAEAAEEFLMPQGGGGASEGSCKEGAADSRVGTPEVGWVGVSGLDLLEGLLLGLEVLGSGFAAACGAPIVKRFQNVVDSCYGQGKLGELEVQLVHGFKRLVVGHQRQQLLILCLCQAVLAPITDGVPALEFALLCQGWAFG